MDSKKLTEQAARAAACDNAQAERLTEALATVLRERLAALDAVAIPGFGNFTAEKHEEHVETDAASGRRMLVPPHIGIQFNPGSKLRKQLSNNE